MSNPQRANVDKELLYTTGQLASTTDLTRAQHIKDTVALGLVAGRLLYDDVNDTFRSGFFGTDCQVTTTGGLGLSVATGVGFQYDSGGSYDDWSTRYTPIVVPSAVALTLSARDATYSRYDVIAIKSATTDDDAESVNVKDPSTGALSSTSISRRRRWYYATITVTGTPAASPTIPATPAGYVKLATVLVPTGGAVTITDCRNILQLAEGVKTPPPTEYHQNFVLGSGGQLLVTASGTPSMVLQVAAGTADVVGTRVQIVDPTTVTIGTADPSNPRIDLVVVYNTGAVGVVAGTAAGSPVAPSVPANAAVLAQVAVAAAATSLNSGTLTDRRIREPYDGTYLTAGTVKAAKMAVVPSYPSLSAGAEAANVIRVTGQVKDNDGNNLSGVYTLKVVLYDMQAQPASSAGYSMAIVSSTGTRYLSAHETHSGTTTTSTNGWFIQTTSTGAFTIDVTDVTTGANRGVFFSAQILNPGGSTAIVDCPFN